MAKRRANGEGNIRKRSDGRWEGRYTAGHDSQTGRAIIKNVLGKTQAEVKEKLKKAIEETAEIDYGRAKDYTVGTWLEVWYENYAKIKMRPSSYLTYRGYLDNHIKPNIGSIPLGSLTTLDLQGLYRKLLEGGRVNRQESQKQPKGLSAKTVRNIHPDHLLGAEVGCRSAAPRPKSSRWLYSAEGGAQRNADSAGDTAGVLPPGSQRERCVRPVLHRPDYRPAPGRVVGAEVGGHRFGKGRTPGASANRADRRRGYRNTTENEKRLPYSAAVGGRDKRSENAEIQSWEQRMGIPVTYWGSNVPGQRAAHAAPDFETAGLPEVRFHDLRHTFATLALQNGVDSKTVSGMLGHFSAGFTLDTYAHVTTAAKRETAQAMENVLSGAIA